MKATALLALLRQLSIIEIDRDHIDVCNGEGDEHIVTIALPFWAEGVKIVITVSDFWRYPGLACYFVNFHGTGGDFACNTGTPYIERAMFNIGDCFGSAQRAFAKG